MKGWEEEVEYEAEQKGTGVRGTVETNVDKS